MRTVININLSGRIIPIEQNIVSKYFAYIETLHGYFADEAGHYEIVSDIEDRMAELMQEITGNGKARIGERDLESIILRIGTVAAFKELDAEDQDIIIAPHEYELCFN